MWGVGGVRIPGKRKGVKMRNCITKGEGRRFWALIFLVRKGKIAATNISDIASRQQRGRVGKYAPLQQQETKGGGARSWRGLGRC